MRLHAVGAGATQVARRLGAAGAASWRRLLLLGLLSAWSLTAMLSRPPAASASAAQPATPNPTTTTTTAPADPPAPVSVVVAPVAVPVVARQVPPLRPPLAGSVVRGFELLAGPYGPGHRGVDIAAPLGTPVLAPAAGQVLFAGPVAGITWASIQVAPGVVVTVGPLTDLAVSAGQRVRTGTRVARLARGHAGALHLGVRIDNLPVDPLPWLASFARPRLAPLRTPSGIP
jgi:murein DD-endopeptidase MepM/ murein hydrolase activator NlpD